MLLFVHFHYHYLGLFFVRVTIYIVFTGFAQRFSIVLFVCFVLVRSQHHLCVLVCVLLCLLIVNILGGSTKRRGWEGEFKPKRKEDSNNVSVCVERSVWWIAFPLLLVLSSCCCCSGHFSSWASLFSSYGSFCARGCFSRQLAWDCSVVLLLML